MKIKQKHLKSIILEEIEKEKNTREVKSAIENVFSNENMIKNLFTKGKIDFPMGVDKNLELKGDPFSRTISFELKKDTSRGNVFLQGDASSLFSPGEMEAMFKIGLRV